MCHWVCPSREGKPCLLGPLKGAAQCKWSRQRADGGGEASLDLLGVKASKWKDRARELKADVLLATR